MQRRSRRNTCGKAGHRRRGDGSQCARDEQERQAYPDPIAIVGIPGGLEVRHDQLKELVKSGTIASYEVVGRDVVLYWRVIEAGRTVELPISLIAAIPGTYTGPAGRAYLYYTDEHKDWVAPLHVTITPKVQAAGH